jgi:protein-S-isoprenylcysteine O-methyltransferase Ste14
MLFATSAAGIVALGIADWGTLALAPWIRLGVGIPVGCAGNALALWAMATLGTARTFGDEGALVIRGPYRFSRNPQYLGFILALLGWALLAGSTLTLTAALAGVIPLLLVPFAEEPWLMERLGPSYAAYKQAVPRFIALWRRSRM